MLAAGSGGAQRGHHGRLMAVCPQSGSVGTATGRVLVVQVRGRVPIGSPGQVHRAADRGACIPGEDPPGGSSAFRLGVELERLITGTPVNQVMKVPPAIGCRLDQQAWASFVSI